MNNDTHGEKGTGWYGFDLDGTLAKYNGWEGIDHIGEPVKPMVELIKRMHDEGKVVKIMTARVAPHKLEDGTVGESYITVPDGEKGATRNYAHQFINDWCHFNLGFIPEIVYQKDHLMLELYDDRVKQVVPNEGWLVEDIAMSKRQRTETTIVKHNLVDIRWASRIQWFLLGMVTATLAIAVLGAVLRPDRDAAERKLRDALTEYLDAGASPLGTTEHLISNPITPDCTLPDGSLQESTPHNIQKEL